MKQTTLKNLMDWDGCKIKKGETLTLKYCKTIFTFVLDQTGSLVYNDGDSHIFPNVNRATLYCIRKMRPERRTVSGWAKIEYNGVKLALYKRKYEDEMKTVLSLTIISSIKQTGIGAASIPFKGKRITFSDDDEEEVKDSEPTFKDEQTQTNLQFESEKLDVFEICSSIVADLENQIEDLKERERELLSQLKAENEKLLTLCKTDEGIVMVNEQGEVVGNHVKSFIIV